MTLKDKQTWTIADFAKLRLEADELQKTLDGKAEVSRITDIISNADTAILAGVLAFAYQAWKAGRVDNDLYHVIFSAVNELQTVPYSDRYAMARLLVILFSMEESSLSNSEEKVEEVKDRGRIGLTTEQDNWEEGLEDPNKIWTMKDLDRFVLLARDRLNSKDERQWVGYQARLWTGLNSEIIAQGIGRMDKASKSGKVTYGLHKVVTDRLSHPEHLSTADKYALSQLMLSAGIGFDGPDPEAEEALRKVFRRDEDAKWEHLIQKIHSIVNVETNPQYQCSNCHQLLESKYIDDARLPPYCPYCNKQASWQRYHANRDIRPPDQVPSPRGITCPSCGYVVTPSNALRTHSKNIITAILKGLVSPIGMIRCPKCGWPVA